MLTREEATARYEVLQRAVAGEKAAIRLHRQKLRTAAAALVDFERRCRQIGISFTLHGTAPEGPHNASKGEGINFHGR